MSGTKSTPLPLPGVVLTAEQMNALQYTSAGMYHRVSDPGWEARRDAGLGITPLPSTATTLSCAPGMSVVTEVSTSESGFTSITKSYETQPNDLSPQTATIGLSQQTAPVLLDTAAGHLRDRAATYDKPEGERSMAKTVAIFNLHHGTSLTEAQGWHLLQILKDVRLFTRGKYHADSAEDCIAYAALKAEAMAK
jgi:hypothetical protein